MTPDERPKVGSTGKEIDNVSGLWKERSLGHTCYKQTDLWEKSTGRVVELVWVVGRSYVCSEEVFREGNGCYS